jgi:hypothetical protein
MKKVVSLVLLSTTVLFASAKIWRVNNVPGVAADFTSAQAAHNGAATGDTIYLESSPNSYGDVTTTKPLTWIGLGYFLTNNTGLQYHANSGFISNLTVNPGSDGSVFEIVIGFFSNVILNSVGNITFLRSYIEGTITVNGTSNHLTITECYLQVGNGAMYIQPSSTQFVFVITNNIIRNNFINVNANSYQVTFNNNTVFTNGSFNNNNTIDNATISNNIFYGVQQAPLNDAGYPSNVTNNLWVQTSNATYVGNNGNIFNADLNNVVVNTSSPDAKWKLAAASPAIGTGAGGVDIGAYGGANPYVVSMLPAIPTIYQLSVPANATGSTLPSTVSTRANN